jgi:hypothetical protein
VTYAHDAHCNVIHDGPGPCPPARCHHVSGRSWCNRKAGHRKPHRYELQPVSDDELMRQVFTLWAAIHPNSHSRMGWVISAEIRERFLEIDRRGWRERDLNVFVHQSDEPLLPGPDLLLGRPVRIGGRSIELEVLR